MEVAASLGTSRDDGSGRTDRTDESLKRKYWVGYKESNIRFLSLNLFLGEQIALAGVLEMALELANLLPEALRQTINQRSLKVKSSRSTRVSICEGVRCHSVPYWRRLSPSSFSSSSRTLLTIYAKMPINIQKSEFRQKSVRRNLNHVLGRLVIALEMLDLLIESSNSTIALDGRHLLR